MKQSPALPSHALFARPAVARPRTPQLHVNCMILRRRLAECTIDPDPDLVDELRERMQRDGYWDIPSGQCRGDSSTLQVEWLVDVAAMAEGMSLLTAAGWPPSFLLMYDEPWIMASQLRHLILFTSGNHMIFDFAFFHVGSNRTPDGHIDRADGASSRGWPPHRDRGTDSTATSFRSDGTPQYCTTWIALSEATTYNSCLYCVPKRYDPGYTQGDGTTDPIGAILRLHGPHALQYVRALPVSRGSVVHFSHRLLHWGSAADEVARQWKGDAPRVALSFASAGRRFEPPFLTGHAAQRPLPSSMVRAGLVAGLALFYVANEDPGEWRLRLYWDVFRACRSSEGCFAERFADVCQTNFEAKQAAWERDAGPSGEAPRSGDGESSRGVASLGASPEAPRSGDGESSKRLASHEALQPDTARAHDELPWVPAALDRFRERTALVWLDGSEGAANSISYGTMISMAHRVVAAIQRALGADGGVSSPTGVGLCLDHGLCIAICQLATLWAGHSFVPLATESVSKQALSADIPSADGASTDAPSTNAPTPHQQHALAMLQGVSLLFCAPQLVDGIQKLLGRCDHPVSVLVIDELELTAPSTARLCTAGIERSWPEAATPPPMTPVESASAHASSRRFCTFYTSGTTGHPKPVHSSCAEFAAFASAAAAPYHLTADSRIFVATSHIFDPSPGMAFAAWAVGAAVCLAPWQQTLHRLRASVERTRATHACSTPSVWALYDVDGEAAALAPKTVLLGGEPMPTGLIRAWLGLGVTLINTYGTTEATVYQFANAISPEVAALPDASIQQHAMYLGVPFEGISVRVVTSRGGAEVDPTEAGSPPEEVEWVPCERGGDGHQQTATGELVLSGVQVGGPERWNGTSDQFHTGDLVQITAGGRLAFVGRSDRQVKVSGRRIELGPIETIISGAMQPLVQRAVVLLVRKQLHAFCQIPVLTPETMIGEWATVHSAAVRLFCGCELPPYMVPAGVTFMTAIPVTATGKTDARALEAMAPRGIGPTSAGSHVDWAPVGWLRTVAACWAAELGVPLRYLSADSDFRALSGSSLVALRICNRLWRLQDRVEGSGGAFGEKMGTYSPTQLLANPVLESYAAMLAVTRRAEGAESAAARGDAAGGVGDNGLSDNEDAQPLERLLTTIDQLAVQAEGVDASGLLQMLLRRSDCALSPGLVDALLISAVHKRHRVCAELLLDHGASPNALGHGRLPVLSMAVQHKDSDMAHSLLMRGADVKALDDDRQTALHHASRTGNDVHCLQLLLRSWEDATATTGCPPDTAPTEAGSRANGACEQLDRWGRTALHWATANGHREAVVALVEAGSDMFSRDFQDESSMDIAERRAECREWLNGQDGVRCDKLTLSMLKLMAA